MYRLLKLLPRVLSISLIVFSFRNGIYPLTAFLLPQPPTRPRAITPEMTEQEKTETPEPIDIESRRVTNMSCQLRKIDDNLTYHLTLLLRMDDKMNRQLQCDFNSADNATILAEELVHYGFINEVMKRNGYTFKGDKSVRIVLEEMDSISLNPDPLSCNCVIICLSTYMLLL